jgi:hypothetical protein
MVNILKEFENYIIVERGMSPRTLPLHGSR